MLSIESFVHNNFDRISNYGSPITDFRVNCLFCEDNYGKSDTKQKLYISLNKHVVHCFRCGYKKNWIGFVMDVLSCNYYQALGELYALPNPKNTRQIFRDLQLPIGKPEEVYNIHIVPLRASDGCSYLSAGRKYARNRGLTEVQWDLYKLGVSTDLPYRLIIPVEDDYYQARAFYGWQEPKYLNPKIPSENCIFIFYITILCICRITIVVSPNFYFFSTTNQPICKFRRHLGCSGIKCYNISFHRCIYQSV